MTYYAYDADGYVGDVATASGWAALAAELLRRGGVPGLELATKGYSEQPLALVQALERVAAETARPAVASTARNLAALARRAHGVLIISDGAVEEPPEDQRSVGSGANYVEESPSADERAEAADTVAEYRAHSKEYAARLKRTLDDLESASREELAAVLSDSREALLAKIKAGGADLTTVVNGLEVPYRSEIVAAVRSMLDRAWERGGRDALAEVRERRTSGQYAYNPAQPRAPKGTPEGGQWISLEDSIYGVLAEAVHELKDISQRMPEAFGSGSEDYYYHVTNAERAASILQSGLVPHGPSYGTEQDSWPDGSTERRSYWVARARVDNVWQFAPEEGKAVLLRAHKGASHFRRESTGDFYTRKRVPAAAIEVLTSGGWRAVGRAVAEPPQKKYSAQSVHSYAAPSFTPRSAMRWLRATAFWVAGLICERILADTKGLLLNALKTGEPLEVTIRRIRELWGPYLGDSTVLTDPEQAKPYRLETIVRTNTTNAYNHGRLYEWSKPEMARFLLGVRYNAVLDERTTEVCRFLDGKVFHPDDPDLKALLPPNHFQCRSIVSPVVVGEPVAQYISPQEKGRARELADQKFLAARAEWRGYGEEWDRHHAEEGAATDGGDGRSAA